ncbi:MAG: exosortase [Pseudomonadota bacterium]|nr:exosortase [Pseudomonadota bacterium]
MIWLVVFATLAACWPTLFALHDQWTGWHDTAYTHGYLIAAVSAYLLWKQARVVTPERQAVSAGALAPLVVLGLIWLVAVRAGLALIQWITLPAILWLAIHAVFGRTMALRCLFAVSFLYFAMPVWNVVNPLFQTATVHVARLLLRVTGIPAWFEGNSVHIPAGTFEIIGGCSGLHYAIVGLAIAALMGEVRADGWRKRAMLLVLAGTLAVLTNWIRVFVIIVIGHYSHMQHYLVAHSHAGFGWVLFTFTMAVFFMIERRMEYAPVAWPPGRDTSGAGMRQGWLERSGWIGVLAVLALLAALQWTSGRPALAAPVGEAVQAPWSAMNATDDWWLPLVPNADLHRRDAHVSPSGEQVVRHEFVFLDQRHRKELGGYANDPLAGASLVDRRDASIAGVPVVLHEVRDAGGSSWLIAVGFSVDGIRFASPLKAQLHYALRSVFHLRSAPSALQLWRVACVPDCQVAASVLEELMGATRNNVLED